MDIKRLPPSILVALGLAGCGPTVDPDDDSAGEATGSAGSTGDVSTSACLDFDPDSTGFTSGPCLGQEQTTTGPCLAPELTTSGAESGSGTGTDGSSASGSGDDSGGDATTTGPCLAPGGDAPPPDTAGKSASARAEILERLRAAGILPPDIAAKLET